eukprot:2131302-Amphidinium_carterae.1
MSQPFLFNWCGLTRLVECTIVEVARSLAEAPLRTSVEEGVRDSLFVVIVKSAFDPLGRETQDDRNTVVLGASGELDLPVVDGIEGKQPSSQEKTSLRKALGTPIG